MPSDVTLVCAAVLNVPVSVVPVLPICVASTVVPISVPLRVNSVSVPKLVTFGCAAVANVPVTLVEITEAI